MKYSFFFASILSIATTSSVYAESRIPMPTKTQIETLASHLREASASGQAEILWADARNTASKVLLIISCYPERDVYTYLGNYLAPDSYGPAVFRGVIKENIAMHMDYHPAGHCLTIDRIDNIKIEAKNAISFRAIFISDFSGETRERRYLMVKQPDGAWLFKSPGLG